MSGAVSRRISSWTDMLFSEHGHAKHNRMEGIAQREINDHADSNYERIVRPAGRLRDQLQIGAVFGSNPCIHAPSEEGPEQQNRAEVAIGEQVRESPGLHALQDRMPETCLQVARHKSSDEKNCREQHQPYGDVPRERRRRPNLNQSVRPVFPEAPYDQHKAHERDQRKQATISRRPDPCDYGRARLAERDEYMRRQEDNQAENEND